MCGTITRGWVKKKAMIWKIEELLKEALACMKIDLSFVRCTNPQFPYESIDANYYE